ncbi:hypothetical protein LCGC14_1673060, partial [marine sediment metagenome]
MKKAANGTNMAIVSKGAGAYELRFSSTNKLTLNRGNVAAIVSSTSTITDTDWHHVVATKTGATSLLYIDGVDVTDTVTDSTMVNTGTAFHIGRRVTASDSFFDGSLDEVAVYPSVLTPAQILAHYNAGITGRGLVSRIAFDTGGFIDYNQADNIFYFIAADTKLMTIGHDGAVDIFHTAAAAGEHGLELIVDTAGKGNIHALDIVLTTGAIGAGDDEEAILVNIDESEAGGGNVVALEVLATEGS